MRKRSLLKEDIDKRRLWPTALRLTMNEDEIKTVVELFQIEGSLQCFNEINSGLINRTYRVIFNLNGSTEKSYIFQKMNSDIFKKPDELMENIAMVTDFIRPKIRTLSLLKCRGRNYCVVDGNYWRGYEFIDGAELSDRNNLVQICSAGRAFGELHKALIDFDTSKLHLTLPDLHNIRKNYEMMIQSYEEDRLKRAGVCQSEYLFLLSVKDIACSVMNTTLPVRVVHNDTKLSNVIITPNNEAVVIDFDNVMPGYIWQDYGDAIRSVVNTASEDEENLENVTCNMDAFYAFSEAYLNQVGPDLSSAEMQSLAISSFAITCELAARFLKDYLDGDRYFHTDKDGQNLNRCRVQIALAQGIWGNVNQMSRFVDEFIM